MANAKDNFDKLYFEFEELHRGSEELIKKRLEFYLPLLKLYRERFDRPKLLDIGCGRGEFLEIAKSEGFEVEGVEINKIYVEMCSNKGLKVYYSDGLNFLKDIPDNHYHVISLIHVIEHLEFDYLLELLSETYRVLEKGGFLILETPYTKNPIVGLYNFWLDPTHKRPIHEEFIKFVGYRIGFTYIDTIGINLEYLKSQPDLTDIFFSSAPDLSIILIKKTTDDVLLNSLKKAIEEIKKRASIGFEILLGYYDNELKTFKENIKWRLEGHEKRFGEYEWRLEENERRSGEYDELIRNLTERINYLEALFMTIYNSKVWRLYRALSMIKRSFKNFPRIFALYLYRKIEKNNTLYKFLRDNINRNPKLKARLKKFLFQESFMIEPQEVTETKYSLDYEVQIFIKKLKRMKDESSA